MTHQEAWNLIPWLVNASLDDMARQRLEQHLSECSLCRDEVRTQRALLQAMHAGPQLEAMPPASLQKLWDRIDASTLPIPAQEVRTVAQPPAPRRGRRLAAAAVAGFALLAGAALVALFRPAGDAATPAYRTVSDAADIAPGDLRVVLAADMTVARLQALLDRAELRIVAGPSASGVYTLALATPGGDAARALATLRADPEVRFAEPMAR